VADIIVISRFFSISSSGETEDVGLLTANKPLIFPCACTNWS